MPELLIGLLIFFAGALCGGLAVAVMMAAFRVAADATEDFDEDDEDWIVDGNGGTVLDDKRSARHDRAVGDGRK